MNDRQAHDPSGPDDVGALIRLAGERRPVPQERFDRVRAAARAEWQREIAVRNRRRAIWTGAGLAAAAGLVLMVTLRILMFGGGIDPTRAPLVETVQGSVSPALEAGDLLDTETEIATGRLGSVVLLLPSGHGIRLGADTRLLTGSDDRLELLAGTIYVDSGVGDEAGHGLSIDTPYGLVEETGTQFEVRVGDGALRVRLREGEVRVHRGDDTHTLAPGDELQVGSDGTVALGAIPLFGEPWEWSESLASLPRVEGRPALEFLQWVARERGLRLVFDGEEPARVADSAILGGSVETLTVEQALAAVLPTCGLEHEIADGNLTVRMSESDRVPAAES